LFALHEAGMAHARRHGLGHPIPWAQVLPSPPLQDEGLIC
jgi:hypothetical protein